MKTARSAQSIYLFGVPLAAVLLTSGCVLDTPPTEPARNDPLPASVHTDSLVRESAQLIGELDGRTFYVADAIEPTHGDCVLVTQEAQRVLEGCGYGPSFESSVPTLTIRYTAEVGSTQTNDGWVAVSPHVSVRDRQS